MEDIKRPLHLKNMPLDIMDYLLKKQLEIKLEKGIKQYSLEQTIYKIIREQKEGK